MKSHRPTAVQRKVLEWMRDSETVVRIETGHKRTTLVEGDHDDCIVLCQTLVLYFLKQHGYIESAAGINAWQLTSKGNQVVRRANAR